MSLGIVAACVCGAAMPIQLLIIGSITDTLLDNEGQDIRNDKETINNLLTTYNISLEQASQFNNSQEFV